MAKKIRELKQILRRAGWYLVAGGGKGSHTKWKHERVGRAVTLSGGDGHDASRAQEKDVGQAVAEATEAEGRKDD